jgi:hypothetical protein
MKNQYFGDINDYHKYALLRALLKGGIIKLLVAWMLTEDDKGPDGNKRNYFNNPKKWKNLDPELFHFLLRLHGTHTNPNVSLIEKQQLLPNTFFFGEKVPADFEGRALWGNKLLKAASVVDLVFLDPDNGFQVKSKNKGHSDSSKYVFWDEVQGIWDKGKSLLIYQHGRREHYQTTVKKTFSSLKLRTQAPLILCFCSGQVLFFLVSQEKHLSCFLTRISLFLDKWEGRIWEDLPKPMKGHRKHFTTLSGLDDGMVRFILENYWRNKVQPLA